ncbi:MAG: hypothetical protein ACI4EF_10825, partial [Coprococcus sp.]
MFKNRKVILSSIAIVFTLIVCSIFVNFALANSGSPTTNGNAGSGSNTSITGYSNIDLAVINSNDASLKATGEDKFNVVQILPNGLSAVAETDTNMTALVTANGYSGNVSEEADFANTSYLWRYVYGEEYFRLAVFNGYKTITTQSMAQGAVQLTSVTVDSLNSMDNAAQAILGKADMIYIYASTKDDYASTASDLSEELYNWLDAYATADRHPLAICRLALCTDDSSSIVGNNDTYRMGALAYKLITMNNVARYDNVLVTESDFFRVLYEEAEGGGDTPVMPTTTKTISDFILTATRSIDEGGNDYINRNTYYKWYDGMSLQDFVNHNVTPAQQDSAYVPVTGGDTANDAITANRKTWNFDNANILVISENEDSDMFNTFKTINSNDNFSYSDYNSTADGWKAVETAPNSELTKLLYGATTHRYVPSGANLFLLNSANLKTAVET